MVVNCGAAFGWKIPGLVWVASLVWLGVVAYSLKYKSLGGWMMAVGGAGNLWQRWSSGGCVMDNLAIPFFGGYNNWWDWMIVAGGLVVGYELWKNRK